MAQPLKNKTLYYEQDYIDASIKWKLELGDEIFKKSDVKKAVKYLKKELVTHSVKGNISLKKLRTIINETFSDALAKKNSKKPEKTMTIEEVEEFIRVLNQK
jgi:hypothetical protein